MLKNPEQTKDKIVQWIRDYFAANGPACSAVIGISGGKDSSAGYFGQPASGRHSADPLCRNQYRRGSGRAGKNS